jgi:hypothetical protein
MGRGNDERGRMKSTQRHSFNVQGLAGRRTFGCGGAEEDEVHGGGTREHRTSR